jgi:hypothetical protein
MDTVFVFGADTGGGAARLTPEKSAEASVENHKMDTNGHEMERRAGHGMPELR